jgi:protein-S-isoprenylcysteine O-methyltransferase Ste14
MGNGRKQPLVADLLATVCAVALLASSALVEIDEPAWLEALGVVMILAAPVFVVLPFLHLRRFGHPASGAPYFATTRVVVEGIYGVVRHPQYLGYSLLLLGLAAIDPHPLLIGLALAAVAFLYVQCILEERYWRAETDSHYAAYAQRVPRLNAALGLWRWARRRNDSRD